MCGNKAVCWVQCCSPLYISAVGNVVAAHSLRYRQYADDTQLYVAVRPSDAQIFESVSMCVEDVARWFL